MQSIFRIFRLGQKKPTYIYRFIAANTMEEGVSKRQVCKTKQALLVIDKKPTTRDFYANEISWNYRDKMHLEPTSSQPVLPNDNVLANVVTKHKDLIYDCQDRDHLFRDNNETGLSLDEQAKAWSEFESEKSKADHKERKRLQNILRKFYILCI